MTGKGSSQSCEQTKQKDVSSTGKLGNTTQTPAVYPDFAAGTPVLTDFAYGSTLQCACPSEKRRTRQDWLISLQTSDVDACRGRSPGTRGV